MHRDYMDKRPIPDKELAARYTRLHQYEVAELVSEDFPELTLHPTIAELMPVVLERADAVRRLIAQGITTCTVPVPETRDIVTGPPLTTERPFPVPPTKDETAALRVEVAEAVKRYRKLSTHTVPVMPIEEFRAVFARLLWSGELVEANRAFGTYNLSLAQAMEHEREQTRLRHYLGLGPVPRLGT